MLIKRVYEADPLACPKCGGQMQVVAFIEPPQDEVIERILKHCGLRQASSPRPPPGEEGWVCVPDDGDSEISFVPDPDWDSQPPSGDVPWEVTGDGFDARF